MSLKVKRVRLVVAVAWLNIILACASPNLSLDKPDDRPSLEETEIERLQQASRVITDAKSIPFAVVALKRVLRLKAAEKQPAWFWSRGGRFLLYPYADEDGSHGLKVFQVEFVDNSIELHTSSWEELRRDKGGLVRPMDLGRNFNQDVWQWLDHESEMLAELQKVTDAVLSPQEDRIAFVYMHRGVRNLAISNLKGKPKQQGKDLDLLLDTTKFRAITAWNFDCFRPSWSPDGKFLAFYTSYHPLGNDKGTSIAVVPTDNPQTLRGVELADHVIATETIPDRALGPEWNSDGRFIIFIGSGILEDVEDPLLVSEWKQKKTYWLDTGHEKHRQVRISEGGLLAFETLRGKQSELMVGKLATSGKP